MSNVKWAIVASLGWTAAIIAEANVVTLSPGPLGYAAVILNVASLIGVWGLAAVCARH